MSANLCANIDNKAALVELRYITGASFRRILDALLADELEAVRAGKTPTYGTRAAGDKTDDR